LVIFWLLERLALFHPKPWRKPAKSRAPAQNETGLQWRKNQKRSRFTPRLGLINPSQWDSALKSRTLCSHPSLSLRQSIKLLLGSKPLPIASKVHRRPRPHHPGKPIARRAVACAPHVQSSPLGFRMMPLKRGRQRIK
jgi:hypothetical protein